MGKWGEATLIAKERNHEPATNLSLNKDARVGCWFLQSELLPTGFRCGTGDREIR